MIKPPFVLARSSHGDQFLGRAYDQVTAVMRKVGTQSTMNLLSEGWTFHQGWVEGLEGHDYRILLGLER